MIHSTAVVHPCAQVPASVTVGPYAVIDEHVAVGANCWIGPHVHLTGHTVIGEGNRFYTSCVIGEAAQDLKYKDEPTRLMIGNDNVFREHVTIHRSNALSEDTTIGSHNFLMVHSHVGHNAKIGDHVIMANGSMLGGHAVVGDRAFISGNCLIHQFVRIGPLALMQGGSAISKDLPPYTIARGYNGICGLNVVGLRRAGFTTAERTLLKRLYHVLFRSRKIQREALQEAEAEFSDQRARELIDFVKTSKRGVCADVGREDSEEET